MKNHHGLVGIDLQNFQCFKGRTEIPLSPLTLFFGPNSAGKSAVLDALSLIQEYLVNIAAERGEGPRTPVIQPSHWSDAIRTAYRSRGTDSEAELVLGVSFVIPRQDFTSQWGVRSFAAIDTEETVTCRIAITVRADDLRISNQQLYVCGISIFLNSVKILERNPGGTKYVLDMSSDLPPIVKYAKSPTWNKYMTKDGRRSTVSASGQRQWDLESVLFLGNEWELDTEVMSDYVGHEHEEYSDEFNLAKGACNEFLTTWNEVESVVFGLCARVLATSCVAASRSIPSPRELTYSFQHADYIQTGAVPPRQTLASGIDEYRELARELYARWWEALSAKGVAQQEGRAQLIRDQLPINRILSECLFVDRIYEVDVDVRVLLGEVKLRQLTSSSIHSVLDGAEALVRLVLRDSEGRLLDFSEVGSGMGYVLPVLVALCSDDWSRSTVFVQQPELHLHPALQTGLADALILASKRRQARTMMIETHSEHILLRLLRRIRQTSSCSLVSPELSLTPDEICVLYFDPTGGDGTRVLKLRVSADGDFLDRWPRGFFTERDEELFN